METIAALARQEGVKSPAGEALEAPQAGVTNPVFAMCEIVRVFNEEKLARGWTTAEVFRMPPNPHGSGQGQSATSMHAAQRRAFAEQNPPAQNSPSG
jgi:hypothetical protein